MKIITLLILTITIASCGQNKSGVEKIDKINNTECNFYENKSIKEIIEILKVGMLDYLQYTDNAYTKEDVEKCIKLIENFDKKITESKSKIEGLKLIEEVVIKLNTLNNKCGGRLIETDQREAICQIIINAGFEKGYNAKNEDTTEKFREW